MIWSRKVRTLIIVAVDMLRARIHHPHWLWKSLVILSINTLSRAVLRVEISRWCSFWIARNRDYSFIRSMEITHDSVEMWSAVTGTSVARDSETFNYGKLFRSTDMRRDEGLTGIKTFHQVLHSRLLPSQSWSSCRGMKFPPITHIKRRAEERMKAESNFSFAEKLLC